MRFAFQFAAVIGKLCFEGFQLRPVFCHFVLGQNRDGVMKPSRWKRSTCSHSRLSASISTLHPARYGRVSCKVINPSTAIGGEHRCVCRANKISDHRSKQDLADLIAVARDA